MRTCGYCCRARSKKGGPVRKGRDQRKNLNLQIGRVETWLHQNSTSNTNSTTTTTTTHGKRNTRRVHWRRRRTCHQTMGATKGSIKGVTKGSTKGSTKSWNSRVRTAATATTTTGRRSSLSLAYGTTDCKNEI